MSNLLHGANTPSQTNFNPHQKCQTTQAVFICQVVERLNNIKAESFRIQQKAGAGTGAGAETGAPEENLY